SPCCRVTCHSDDADRPPTPGRRRRMTPTEDTTEDSFERLYVAATKTQQGDAEAESTESTTASTPVKRTAKKAAKKTAARKAPAKKAAAKKATKKKATKKTTAKKA